MNEAYTSPRAARKITLSRRPASASRPRIVQICHIGSTPDRGVQCGDRTGAVGEQRDEQHHQQRARTARTSNGVRAVPLVSGIRFGHGGSRMVLGRNQYRIDPSGGKNRLFSGPNPQPEADDLEQHRVEHDLFEHDRLGRTMARRW